MTKCPAEQIEQVRDRFERDFLPKYGGLWRQMIERRAAAEEELSKPKAAAATNFLEAIQQQTTMSIQVPSQGHHTDDNGDGCDCQDCAPPIFEWETQDAEAPRDHMIMGHPSSSEGEESQGAFFEARLFEADEPSYEHATTPLPTDLEGHFGRLSFGIEGNEPAAIVEKKRDPGSAATIMKTEDDSGTRQEVEERPFDAKPNDWVNVKRESDRVDNGKDDASSTTAGGSVIQFDISHIVDKTPNKGLVPQHSNLHTSPAMTGQIMSPEQNPQFSPNQEEEGESASEEFHSAAEDHDDTDSQSSGSTCFDMDLSRLVQSPKELGIDSDLVIPKAIEAMSSTTKPDSLPISANSPTFPASPMKDQMIMPPDLNPCFSPILQEGPSDDEREDINHYQDSESESSDNMGFQMDLSQLVQSPVAKTIESSPSNLGVAKHPFVPSPQAKSDDDVAPHVPTVSESIVIDLLDSDDDSADESMRTVPLLRRSYAGRSSQRAATKSYTVVDSSDDNMSSPKPKRNPQDRPNSLDEDSDENEWDGESSSEASFESPDEISYGETDRRGRSLKFATGDRSSSFVVESDEYLSAGELSEQQENWNPNSRAHKRQKPKMSKAAFKKVREALTKQSFHEFDTTAFNGGLAGVEVIWSNKLRTTAGLTRLKKVFKNYNPGSEPGRKATIELSIKVLDDPGRLRSTLLHEMVHAAAWIVDGVSKPPHGACFKKWANVAMRNIPDLEVTTTHDYQIQYKFAWACTTPGCTFLVQRHSRSVDLMRHCCGRCKGRLIEVDPPSSGNHSPLKNAEKTPKKRAPPSGYNLFVKEQSKTVRARLMKAQNAKGIQDPKVSQPEVMKECARLWQIQKKALLS